LDNVRVEPRVRARHPELSDEDVLTAWSNCLVSTYRQQSAFDDFVAIGTDAKGRLIEMIAVQEAGASWAIYHAMTPPTDKVLHELGLKRDGRKR
jgi:hypothetical protein